MKTRSLAPVLLALLWAAPAPAEDIQRLLQQLESETPQQRIEAATALSLLGDEAELAVEKLNVVAREDDQPEVRAAACFFATDMHTGTLGDGDDSLARAREIQGELLMIWGRQDPHIPEEGRRRIYATLHESAGQEAGLSHLVATVQLVHLRRLRGDCEQFAGLRFHREIAGLFEELVADRF